MMWPNMMGGFFGGFGIIWMIFMFIFWAAIITGVILLIIWAVKRANIHTETGAPKNNALEQLKERYAKGEITKEQFEQIRKDII